VRVRVKGGFSMAMNCYNCGEPGHFAANCPLSVPAGSFDEHMARIGRFVEEWQEGIITIEQKRHRISDENKLYYGPGCRKALTYP
jgi:hypothetical protein